MTPYPRLVWTNDEGGDGGPVSTVTFEENGGMTLLVMHELYPSKNALEAAGTGAADAMGETFEQLDELLVTLGNERGTVVKSSISWSADRLFTTRQRTPMRSSPPSTTRPRP